MKSLQLTKPYLLVAVGLPGSGKTFFAKQFSDIFNTPYVDYGYYSRVVDDKKTRETIIGHTFDLLFRTKQAIVIEGRGATQSERKALAELAAKHSYRLLFIWVQTEPATAEHRAVYAKSATMKQEDFDRAIKQFDNLNAREPYMVISGKHTFSSQLKMVLKRLATDRPAVPTPKPPAPRASIRPTPRTNRDGRISIG